MNTTKQLVEQQIREEDEVTQSMKKINQFISEEQRKLKSSHKKENFGIVATPSQITKVAD